MYLRQRSLQISVMMEKIIFSGNIIISSISIMDISNGHKWVKFAVCDGTGMFLQSPPASHLHVSNEQSTRMWQTAHLDPSSVTFRNEGSMSSCTWSYSLLLTPTIELSETRLWIDAAFCFRENVSLRCKQSTWEIWKLRVPCSLPEWVIDTEFYHICFNITIWVVIFLFKISCHYYVKERLREPTTISF